MPAVIGGPFGRFSHQKASVRQIWIAGGIGHPFPQLAARPRQPPLRGLGRRFYTPPAPTRLCRGIKALAGRHDINARAHVNSSSEGTSPPSVSCHPGA